VGYLEVQRLAVIAEDYRAVRGAVVQALLDTSQPGSAVLGRAEGGLETAYIARLFSEFEAILRPYLRANDPRRRPVPRSIYSVINRTVSVWHIPNALRDDVHQAREYRNSVVHADSTTRAAIPFSDAQSILNKFLARLP